MSFLEMPSFEPSSVVGVYCVLGHSLHILEELIKLKRRYMRVPTDETEMEVRNGSTLSH